MEYKHIPVMLEEVLDFIGLKKGDKVVDCTLGGAGYTLAMREAVGEAGLVVSFDLDKAAIKNAERQIKEKKIKNIILLNDSFHNLRENLKKIERTNGFSAVVMDLGLSSAQLDDDKRGFSFKNDAPLDMTFGGSGEDDNPTQDIINFTREKELEKIISQFGEERFARRIAAQIVLARKQKKIRSTIDLVEIIRAAVPENYVRNSQIHFATRTFQAFRIASNEELKRLELVLPQALEALKSGGRLAVVSFHSLEDRIVKNFFKNESTDCLCPPEIPICRCGHEKSLKIITKKPVEAGSVEIKNNPRARSAKLRVAEKK